MHRQSPWVACFFVLGLTLSLTAVQAQPKVDPKAKMTPAEKAKADKAAADKAAMDKAKGADPDKAAKDKAKADRAKALAEKAARDKAALDKADREKAEKDKADKAAIEKARAAEGKAEVESATPVEETVGPPSPLRLAEGLRAEGLSDLAIEYLNALDPKALTPVDQAALPFERAKSKLSLAADETEEGTKAALFAEAGQELQKFLNEQKSHPKRVQAALALAKLTSLQAKALAQKARRVEDKNEAKKKELRRAEAAKVRPEFDKATKLFAEAAKDLASQEGSADAGQKRVLARERMQAELDGGKNQYERARTYLTNEEGGTPTDIKDRAVAYAAARKAFEALAAGPLTSPFVWEAKAWMAECDQQQDKGDVAKAAFDEINKTPLVAADAGRQVVQYFEIVRGFSGDDAAAIAATQKKGKAWLDKYDRRRPTAEAMHVKFLVGVALQVEVRGLMGNRAPKVPEGQKPKWLEPNATERAKLAEADRLFKQLAETENDYAVRAVKRHHEIVRLLVGDAEREPREYAKFEEAHMAALVQQAKLADAEDGDAAAVKKARTRLLDLLERARELATAKDPAADVADDLLRLTYFYLSFDQPYHAAVLGEHLARNGRGATKPAAAGLYAVNGYLAAAQKGDGAAQKADKGRAFDLALFLVHDAAFEAAAAALGLRYPEAKAARADNPSGKKLETDPATDEVRVRLGYLLYTEGKPLDAFAVLSQVRSSYPRLLDARLLEGVVAFQLLAANDSPVKTDKAKRAAVYAKALADLDKVPPAADSAEAAAARDYVRLRARVALLNLLKAKVDGPEGKPEAAAAAYAKAEQVADEALDKLPAYKALDADNQRLELEFLLKDARARAVYLQARTLFADKKYGPLFDKIGPMLDEMAKDGPAALMKAKQKDDDGKVVETVLEGSLAKSAGSYDANRRDLIVLGLKGRIREGNIDAAGKLLDLLETFGGNADTTIATLQQLAIELRGQIVDLRKEGQKEEADKVTEGFTELLAKLSARPNLKASVRMFVGSSLVAVEQYEKAAEELAKIPAAPAEDLAAPFAGLSDEKKDAVRAHRSATLSRLRALRLGKKFADADKLAAEVMGTAAKPGWAANSLDYMKETYLLAEDKGAATAKVADWSVALQGWQKLAGGQAARLRKLLDEQVLLQREQAQVKKAAADPAVPAPKPDDLPEAKLARLASLNGEIERGRAVYHDFYFETIRCVIKANASLFAGPANATKLQGKYEAEAKKVVTLEGTAPNMAAEVRKKFHDFLQEKTDFRDAYKNAGGKLFLAAPDDAPGEK